MAKIVVVSDFSFQGSGYLNIIVPLCKGLAELGHEIKAVGLGYRGEEHDFDFSILPCQSITDAQAMTNNLKFQWGAELMLVALDIPIQGAYINLAKQLGIKIISITPLENPPLTMSWAFMLQNSDKVFFISQLGADEAQKAGVETAEHLVVGMDTKSWRLRTADEYTKGRQLFSISPDTLVVLTVADNQERKNLSKAMEIVSKVKDEGIKVKYILVTREHSEVGWKLRDLAMDYNIASELMIFERGMSFGELYSLYAIADVFLLTSKAEGLGMPVMEAMSCFTGDTYVEAENPELGMVSKYTGEMLEIVLDGGIRIVCTPDHPFYTLNGWQYAKDLDIGSPLLYNSSKILEGDYDGKIGPKGFYAGRIESVVRTLQNNESQTDCRDNGENRQTDSLAGISVGTEKANSLSHYFTQLGQALIRGVSLFSWNSRWGRNNNYTQDGGKEKRKLETSNSDFKYFNRPNKVDTEHSGITLNVHLQKGWNKNGYGRFIHILYNWFKSFIPISETSTLHENKEEATRINYSVFAREDGAVGKRPAYPEPTSNHFFHPRAEYKAITEIQKKFVENLDVYNLKTQDGVYYANGVLVHNCGVPVVATSCGAMPELLGDERGLLLDTEYSMIDPWGNSRRDFPSTNGGVYNLMLVNNGRDGTGNPSLMVRMAREYMESRTWDTPIGQVNKSIKELLDAKE